MSDIPFFDDAPPSSSPGPGPAVSASAWTSAIDGTVYDFGLSPWETFFEHTGRPLALMAKEHVRTRQQEFGGDPPDLFCVGAGGGAFRYGLGRRSHGHRPGHQAAILAVMAALGQDWLVCLRFPFGFWLAYVKKGSVVVDAVYDEQSARGEFLTKADLVASVTKSRDAIIYTSEDWGAGSAAIKAIAPSLYGEIFEPSSSIRLRPVNSFLGNLFGIPGHRTALQWMTMGGMAAAIAGVIGGVYFVEHAVKQREAARAAAARATAIRHEMSRAVYAGLPMPASFVSACEAMAARHWLPHPGLQPDGWTCSIKDGVIAFSVKFHVSGIAPVPAADDTDPDCRPSQGACLVKGRFGGDTWPAESRPASSDQNAGDLAALVSPFFRQGDGALLNLRANQPRIVTVPSAAGGPPRRDAHIEFTLSGAMVPWAIHSLTMPGTVLSEVSFTYRGGAKPSGSWTIKGIIHAEP